MSRERRVLVVEDEPTIAASVAARLRAEGQAATMLVALTGYGREDDIRRSRDAGFDHHLSKPIDFAQLRPIIAEVSARRA